MSCLHLSPWIPGSMFFVLFFFLRSATFSSMTIASSGGQNNCVDSTLSVQFSISERNATQMKGKDSRPNDALFYLHSLIF